MNKKLTHPSAAFTLIELLMVIAALVLIAAMIIPALHREKAKQRRIACVSNLKHVSLGFRIWANDNGDRFPFGVSTNFGGTLELIGTGNTFMHLKVTSNELNTPRILLCFEDSDRKRKTATVWDSVPSPAQVPFVSNSNLSFFVGVTAFDTNPGMFLAGDDNLTNGVPAKNGILSLTPDRPAGWTRKRHNRQGNIALADGSVMSLSTRALTAAVASSGTATNIIEMP